jgi:hypothetical protein
LQRQGAIEASDGNVEKRTDEAYVLLAERAEECQKLARIALEYMRLLDANHIARKAYELLRSGTK